MRRRTLVGGLVTVVAAAGLAALLSTCGHVGEPPSALEVIPDPIDFGEVRWGDNVERPVKIRNRSTHSVTLKDPAFDCTCFALTIPPAVLRLEGGQEVTVKIVLRSQLAKEGPMRKTFTVRSDDPIQPKLDVPLLGTVRPFSTIDPQRLDYGDVDPLGEPVEKVVKVRSAFGFHVKVLSGQASVKTLAVEVREPADGQEGSDVVVKTAKGAKGSLEAQVLLTLEVRSDRGGTPTTVTDSVWTHGELR